MTEQTETERNEAKIGRENGLKILDMVNAINKGTPVKLEADRIIEELEVSVSVAHLEFWMGKNYSNFKLKKETIEAAITALKQQSEAERRIERAREYCRRLIGFFNRQVVISSEARRYVEGKTEAYNKILEILEGKESEE